MKKKLVVLLLTAIVLSACSTGGGTVEYYSTSTYTSTDGSLRANCTPVQVSDDFFGHLGAALSGYSRSCR